MEHFFELPVNYKGEELSLKGRLVTFAYVYRFYIIAQGKELIFERDDEHQCRVLATDNERTQIVDPHLLEEIIRVLNDVQLS
jgi:hypothetical protein